MRSVMQGGSAASKLTVERVFIKCSSGPSFPMEPGALYRVLWVASYNYDLKEFCQADVQDNAVKPVEMIGMSSCNIYVEDGSIKCRNPSAWSAGTMIVYKIEG